MLGSQNLRFIGGPWHGQVKPVAPSAKEIGTCCAHDFAGNPKPSPADTTYTRRVLVLVDAISRYEEICMVDVKEPVSRAVWQLRSLLNTTPRIPSAINTKPLKLKLESTLIGALAYDKDTQTLDVTFKSGGAVYRYTGVTPAVLGELLVAESIGKAYGDLIRNKFPCVKLSAAVEEEKPKAPAKEPGVFKVGDRVVCIEGCPADGLQEGKEYIVTEPVSQLGLIRVAGIGPPLNTGYFFASRFKHA